MESAPVDAGDWKRSLYCFDFYCLAEINLLTCDNLMLWLTVFTSLLLNLTLSGLLLFSDSHVT